MQDDRTIVAQQSLSWMVNAGENSVSDGHGDTGNLDVSLYGPIAAPLSIDCSIMPFTTSLI